MEKKKLETQKNSRQCPFYNVRTASTSNRTRFQFPGGNPARWAWTPSSSCCHAWPRFGHGFKHDLQTHGFSMDCAWFSVVRTWIGHGLNYHGFRIYVDCFKMVFTSKKIGLKFKHTVVPFPLAEIFSFDYFEKWYLKKRYLYLPFKTACQKGWVYSVI